jgi:replicative DNA helicase
MKNVLEPDFQTSLLKTIVQDTAFLSRHRALLEEKMFKDAGERDIAKRVIAFYDKYLSTPSKTSLVQVFTDEGFDRDDVKERIAPYYDNEIRNTDYIRDKTLEFVRKIRLQDTLVSCTRLLDAGDFSGILDSIRKVVGDFESGDDLGDLFWKNKKKVLQALDVKEDFIPTGLSWLDEALDGGPRRGTENVIVTPPNKGKTTMLVNIGKYAALAGFNVAHYTLELSSKVIQRRYFMSMVRMSKADLKDRQKTAYDKICKIAEKVCEESLIVKQYSSRSASLDTIRGHLHKIKNTFGFFPDVIIIDYGDLLKPQRMYEEKRHELADTFRGIRDLGVEFNAVTWTATQTNRTGNRQDIITIDDLAECFEKAAVADTIVSVNQTLEEKRARPPVARLFMAKSRDDESLISGEIITEWDKAFCGNREE